MTRQIRLLRSFLTVGAWTLISRISGFVRDIMIAAFLGAGPVAEAFVIAFSLPNMFRRFFAEGAFNTAFIPMFSKKVESGEDAEAFARDALSGLAAVLLVFTLIAQLIMPWLVLAMAAGFQADERFALTVDFGRVVFPYILFISIAALLSGVLNALGRFAAAAAAPVMLNLILIAVIAAAHQAGRDIGWAMAWAVPVAGIAQMFVVWIAAARAGLRLVPRLPRLTPELRRLAVIAAPAALAGGVVQINLLVGRQVASFFEGAVVWLNFADRLYQLPLGVVGIAIGVVLLPDLSRRLKAGDEAGSRNSVNRAAEFALAMTVPAAVALVVVATPLVSVLFQHGAFTAADSAATAAAVAIYGLGLPAFVLQKILQPVFFAREDTRSPFRYAVVAMIANAGLAIGLAPFIGYLAAAIGTTLSGWLMLWLLWRGSRRFGEAGAIDLQLRRRAPRIVLSAAIMGVALWFIDRAFAELWLDSRRYWALALLVVAGAVVFAAAALATRAMSLRDFRRYLRG